MSKTIEDLAEQFAKELYPEDDLDTLGDKVATYMTCVAFGNQLMNLPLIDRLTAKEKERVKVIYNRKRFGTEYSNEVEWMEKQLLEHLFGKDLFKK